MDIITEPLTSANAAANAAAVSRLDVVTGINALNPTTTTEAVDLTPLSSTTVDLSPLGQFLSSLSLSRKTLTQLQGGTAATADNNNAEAVTTAAQQLASAFNALQTNAVQTSPVGTAQSSIDRFADNDTDSQSTQQTPAANANAASNLDSLAQLGITLQTTPQVVDTDALDNTLSNSVNNAANNSLVVNEQALQAAFAANPAGTVETLNQAANTLYAYGANLLEQTANAVAQTNSVAVLESESAQALQQAATVRDTFAADNNPLDPQSTPATTATQNAQDTLASQQLTPLTEESAAAAIAQTTLGDMALTDLLGETQQVTQAPDAISDEQQLQATTLAAANAAQQNQAADAAANTTTQNQLNAQINAQAITQTGQLANELANEQANAQALAQATELANTQALAQTNLQANLQANAQASATQAAANQATQDQAAATQAASVQAATQAEQASDAANDQQQADAAQATEQAANAAIAAQQANSAIAANAQAQSAIDASNAQQAVQQANAAASNNALQANAETGVEQANRLARDPAIAAAIAAYHLNDGPLNTSTAEQELAILSQRQAIAPVAPVTRVDPADKV